MTNREICERILEILVQRGGYEAHIAVYQDLRSLLLDLAAPDEHFAAAGKMMGKKHEEETPPLFTYTDEGQKSRCPQCGQLCVRDMVTGNWWCRTHGSFKSKRVEENHIADLGKKGATLPDGTPINLCGGDK